MNETATLLAADNRSVHVDDYEEHSNERSANAIMQDKRHIW